MLEPKGLSQTLRVLTYNICGGSADIGRIGAVIGEVGADVVALQEVLESQVAPLQQATGAHGVFAPTRRHKHTMFGNLCLTRLPLVAHEQHDISSGFEARSCLRVDIEHPARHLRIFNVHLGLGYFERIRQARMLSSIFDRARNLTPRLLLGDFNEWFHGHASRLFHAEFGHPFGLQRRVRTHPSILPVFSLDRIYRDPEFQLDRVVVHRTPLARNASDHLPTFADLRVARATIA